MTPVVLEHQVREWLDHPVSRLLKQVLLHRRGLATGEYLSGRPVDPLRQGQAMALNWGCQLLDLPPDQLTAELRKQSQQDRKELKE